MMWTEPFEMQTTLFPITDVYKATSEYSKQKKLKRRWENAFQRWSDKEHEDGHSPEGYCGYGSMCDYCEDNSYGRPCVRALNAMLRDKKIRIDYTDYDFKKVWGNYG